MADNSKDAATEEAGSVITRSSPGKEPRSFLSVGRKDLTEEDLATPGVRRFLIAEIERLDAECSENRTLRDRYNARQVEIATLRAALRTSRGYELMSFVCLSVGSIGIGAAVSYLIAPSPAPLGWIVLWMSVLLSLAGIVARVFK